MDKKGLFQICMHHNRVYTKVEFPRFPTDLRIWGGGSESSFTMSRLNLNWKILGDILVSLIGRVIHLSTFDLELRNVSFELISFMGFPAILCALQPYQICIFKRKYSKLSFSNGSQLMGKALWHICMHHWRVHAKLELPRFPTDFTTRGSQSSFNFWSWTQKCKFCTDIFYGVSCNIKCITAISNLHSKEKIQ